MRISKAWQAYLQGLLKTPQEIYRAFHNEREPIPDRFFVIPVDGEKFDAPARLLIMAGAIVAGCYPVSADLAG